MSTKFRVAGRGEVTIEELRTMIRDFQAGRGPEPQLDGGADARVALMHYVETKGDAEMQAEFGAFISQRGQDNDAPSRGGDNPTLRAR